MAVFDNDGRLVDYFDEKESMGLLWVMNRVKNREITMPHVEGIGETICLEKVNAKSKIMVDIEDDGLPVFEIKTQASFDILEQFRTSQGLSDGNINDLEQMAARQVINEIEAAVKKSQQLKTDVFGFGEEVRRQRRKEWPQYKDQWQEIYPLVNVIIECETLIRDRELAVDPPGSRREEAGQ